MKKALTIILSLFLVSAMLFAGGPKETKAAENAAEDSEKTVLEIYWWGAAVRNDLTQKAIDLYMEINPDVQINAQFADWTGYWDKLSAMAAGGNMPDVVQMDYSYIEQYVAAGLLEGLNKYIESGALDTSKIPQSIIESGSVDGECYALSLGTNTTAMFYNKTLTDSLGIEVPVNPTFDELYDISQRVYDGTDGKVLTDFSFGALQSAQMVARDYGSDFFAELKAGDSTSAEKYFELVSWFRDAPFAVSPEQVAEVNLDDATQRLVIKGTTWNDYMMANQYVFMAEAADAAGFELGICNYPHNADATSVSWFLKPAMFFSVAASSDVKDEALAVIAWFTNSKEANEILLGERGVPVNTEISEFVTPLVSEDTGIYFSYVNEVAVDAAPIDPPDPAGKGEVESYLNSTIEAVRYGDYTASEAAELLTERAEQILNAPQG